MQTRKGNLGKKLASVLLSAAMAFTACTGAFAQEEAASAAKSTRISNLSIVNGEQVIDLSGLGLEVDVIEDSEDGSVCIHLDADGQTVAKVGITTVDGLYVYHLESPTLGTKDFVINPTDALAQSLDQGVEMLVGFLQNVDTHALAETIMKLSEPKEEAETEVEAETEAEAAEPETEITVEGDIASVLENCLVDAENVQMGGAITGANGQELTIAEGTYNTRELTLDTDAICQILDMVYVNGQETGASKELRDAGAEILLHIYVIQGTTDDLNRVVSMKLVYNVPGEQDYNIDMDVNRSAVENGQNVDAMIGGTVDGQKAGLTFSVFKGQHDGELFSAADVDMENAVVLTDMDEEASDAAMSEAVSALATDVLGTVLAPVMSALAANMDMSALETATEVPAE